LLKAIILRDSEPMKCGLPKQTIKAEAAKRWGQSTTLVDLKKVVVCSVRGARGVKAWISCSTPSNVKMGLG
jgi:hypothetical protein